MRALQLIEDRKLETVDVAAAAAAGARRSHLRIKAVALNHIDVWGWRGMAFAKRKLPLTIGAEASGEVEAVGPASPDWRPASWCRSTARAPAASASPAAKAATISASMSRGVHGFHLDGFAQEKINLPARLLVPAPPGVDAIGAAVAPVTFGTVEHMLFDNAKLQPGETILVHAGGSGIGSAAIQLAKKMGCTVITTVGSDDKIEQRQGARRRPRHQLPRGPLRGRRAQADQEEGRRRRLRACRRRHLGRLDAVPEARRPAGHLRLDLRRLDAR